MTTNNVINVPSATIPLLGSNNTFTGDNSFNSVITNTIVGKTSDLKINPSATGQTIYVGHDLASTFVNVGAGSTSTDFAVANVSNTLFHVMNNGDVVTLNNTLDDGSGNATIASTKTLNVDNVKGASTDLVLNPHASAQKVWANKGIANATFNINQGSSTSSLFQVFNNTTQILYNSGSGVFTLQNTLDDGSGNATVATTMTSPLFSCGNGTASAPSYTFSSDTDLGMYRISEDVLGITCAGAQVANFNNNTNILASFLGNPILQLTKTDHNTTATVLGSELAGGIIHCAPAGSMTLTFDTAANIYSAMGSPPNVGAALRVNIVATSGVVTVATNTGLTFVVGTTTISASMKSFLFVVTNTATPTITVYGG